MVLQEIVPPSSRFVLPVGLHEVAIAFVPFQRQAQRQPYRQRILRHRGPLPAGLAEVHGRGVGAGPLCRQNPDVTGPGRGSVQQLTATNDAHVDVQRL